MLNQRGTKLNLKPFYTKANPYAYQGRVIQEVSLYKNIPMSELENVKSFLRGKGLTFRIRYRGPRSEFSDIRPKVFKERWFFFNDTKGFTRGFAKHRRQGRSEYEGAR